MGHLDRAKCTVHLMSAPDQPGRMRMYHYIREAKSLLSKYIYCGIIPKTPVCLEVNYYFTNPQGDHLISFKSLEAWAWYAGPSVPGDRGVKAFLNLKSCLDYCEDPAISCENLNFCFPAKTERFYWLRSQCSFLRFFSVACNLRLMDGKIEMFITS